MQERLLGSVRVFYPKLDKKSLFIALKEKAEEIRKKFPIKLMVVFGSYARGNFTVASDVDLLVVYQGEERRDLFAPLRKMLNIPRLEIHLYSEKEYQEVKDSIDKMTKGGMVVLPEG